MNGNFKKMEAGQSQKSEAEETFLYHCKGVGLSTPERWFKFHPKRKWEFDFAWVSSFIAVECEGGVFSGGRHTRGKGYSDDCIKYNEAQLLGWKVYRFTSQQVKSGEAIGFMERVFKK